MLISKINEVYLNLKVDEDLERELNSGLPMYTGTSQVASLLRYLRKMGDEIMNGTRNYI